ncbi:oxidoreductase [Arcobacter sp. CECT 8986]|uniref:Gfo/Idh/MocA family protein n=1 Tax=Arcobacter sp. CECT 8986 TaxID=2044507 RepID=UPI001009FE2A|nr:Gfo/Idh/MocA family oxidoreductase [Arcobacter sp. CECT 8986]RXK01257.1 oxidoreductase [Arcobacter sp. CECT 8986]
MNNKIRVGFIGLNFDSHWAFVAHYPALKFLKDDFEIVGVANSTYESAKKSAEVLNIPFAFETANDLVNSDEIDLVVVTVKVPYHFELVSAALNAGKNVHCEWPLGNGLEEAIKLAQLAKQKGVVATVGNQMRVSVEVNYIKQMLNKGFVGDVLSSTLVGDGGQWGAQTIKDLAYLSDKSKGATMLTIPFGHTLAGIQEVIGNITDISGRLITRRDKVLVADTNETITQSAADQIMANGVFQNGAAFSAHYRGGLSKGTNFLWEINGTNGDIQVRGDIGHGQFANFEIYAAKSEDKELKKVEIPKELYQNKPEDLIPRNVAGIYALIASDIKNGTKTAPSFDDAVQLHKLLDSIAKN